MTLLGWVEEKDRRLHGEDPNALPLSEDDEKARTKAMQLVTLAMDRSASTGEGANAAVAACRIVAAHALLGPMNDEPAGETFGLLPSIDAPRTFEVKFCKCCKKNHITPMCRDTLPPPKVHTMRCMVCGKKHGRYRSSVGSGIASPR